jgi:DNA end-binding protein Ku
MMRAIWTGSISFGLINIPVRLYSAMEEHPITFDLLHKPDLSPIRYARICKEEEKEVPYSEIVKGYEYQDGEYVVVDEEDFKRADEQKFKTIEIQQFTDLDDIEFIYFAKPYYLEPGKGADKAYALLRESMKLSKKVAIVKFVFKNKEHLGVLNEYHNAIILNQMHFYEELRDMHDLKLPPNSLINKNEIDMSLKLIQQLTDKFHPDRFHDEYTDELKGLIEEKVKNQGKAPRKKTSQKPAKIHDITALLEASLKEAKAPKKVSKKQRA